MLLHYTNGNTKLNEVDKMKVEVNQTEYKALVELMSDAKVPVPLGYILGNLMSKIEQALRQDQEKQLKEKFNESKGKTK